MGDKYERIFHMGRLDYDSEGLILMTNDGELSQHVMHPKYEVEKTYVATLEGQDLRHRVPSTRDHRVQLDDGWIKLDHCAIIDSSRDHTMVKVVLHSGQEPHRATYLRLNRLPGQALGAHPDRPDQAR